MDNSYNIGSLVLNNWTIHSMIGEGSFGRVYEIIREDFGEIYRAALKVITVPRNSSEVQDALTQGMSPAQAKRYFYSVVEDIVREFAIMSRFKGTANVVSYEDHEVVPHENGIGWDILIRMELLNPLLPYAYEHPFSRRDIIRLGISLCHALELCQKYNVIHRDIKPENIFISDNGDYKLGDFGIARTIEKTTSGLSKKGTYSYMAPEVYKGEKYGFNVDLYSLGIVMYRLLNRNRIPFMPPAPAPITRSNQEQALVRRMSGGSMPLPYYAQGRLGEIVLKACAYNSGARYSSPMQLRQELEAVLYDERDASLIYPDGDDLAISENRYISQTPSSGWSRSDSGAQHTTNDDISAAADTYRSEATEKHTALRKATGSAQSSAPRHAAANKPAALGKRRKRKWPAVVAVVLIAVAVGGFCLFRLQAQRAAEEQYLQLMEAGESYCESDPERAKESFLAAQELRDDEAEPYISYAYALYCNREYADCVNYVENDLTFGRNYATQDQNRLYEILGAAYFEQGDYAAAASNFRAGTAGEGGTVSAMRDYAVSLGRLGGVDEAGAVLRKLIGLGAGDDVTAYVQAEISYAQQDYLQAEEGFSMVLNTTSDAGLQRRALRSLAEVYRDCAALVRLGTSLIETPATKEVEVLASGIEAFGLRYDSTLWEMLGLAYFEAYHTDVSVPDTYLTKAAECFNRVIELGVTKNYLYANLYTVYYEQRDYGQAEQALKAYSEQFPNDYTPHALRAMLLITQENEKDASERNYAAAEAEYELAVSMTRGGDDLTYLQQLESLIEQLRRENWL